MSLRLRPAAVLAALAAGAFAFAYYNVHPVPAPVVDLVRGDDPAVVVRGGAIVEVTLPPELTPAERAQTIDVLARRARQRDPAAEVRERADGVVEIAASEARSAQALAEALAVHGYFELRPVIAGSKLAQELFAQAQTGALGPEVKADTDTWRSEESSKQWVDQFLYSHDPDALRRAAASRAPEAGEAIAFERIVPAADARDPRPFERTWVVGDQVIVSQRDVAEAVIGYDPNTDKPYVQLDFDRAGATRFGDWTASHVGWKLAILVDGRVSSAPVVNGPIRGGRASITMGSADADKALREAEDLVAALRVATPLPAGIQVRTAATYPADARLGLARALVALAAALAALGVVWLLGRWRALTAAVATSLPPGRGGAAEVIGRALVTAAVIAGVVLLRRWPMPTLHEGALHWLLRGGSVAPISVGAIGITPIIAAAILVELVALELPGWRQRRHAGYAARRPLRTAVAVTALILTVLQAYVLTSYLEAMNRADIIDGDRATTAMTFAWLVTGVTLQAIGALVITRFGLGAGFGVLLAVPLVSAVAPLLDAPRAELGLLAAGAALIAIVTGWATRSRVAVVDAPGGTVRLPVAGLVPLMAGAAQLALSGGIAATALDTPRWERSLGALGGGALGDGGVVSAIRAVGPWPTALAVAMLAAVLTWAFARPVRELALVPAMLASAGFAVAVVAIDAAGATVAVAAAVTTAVVIDLVAEARARWRGRLIAVEEYHDVHLADAALAAEGGHLRSVHLRALLRIAGPYVPVWRLVPAAAAEAPAAVSAAPAPTGP